MGQMLDLEGILSEFDPGLGQGNTSRTSGKKRHTKLFFQILDLAAERRLGDQKLFGGFGGCVTWLSSSDHTMQKIWKHSRYLMSHGLPCFPQTTLLPRSRAIRFL